VFDVTGFELLLAVDLRLHPVKAAHMFGHGIPCNRISGYRISGLHGSLYSMFCNNLFCTMAGSRILRQGRVLLVPERNDGK
jgi:hypothetical protein